MQSHRSIYYWFMQGLSRITPSRYWRKELHYLSHLSSFAKLAHNLSIRRNYKKIIKDGDRELTYDYAAICRCGNAKQYKGWEIQDTKHRSNYYTPYMDELGL